MYMNNKQDRKCLNCEFHGVVLKEDILNSVKVNSNTVSGLVCRCKHSEYFNRLITHVGGCDYFKPIIIDNKVLKRG